MQTEIFDGVCGGLSYRYTISFKVSSFDPKKKGSSLLNAASPLPAGAPSQTRRR
jgi:hypothetical protein